MATMYTGMFHCANEINGDTFDDSMIKLVLVCIKRREEYLRMEAEKSEAEVE